MLTEHDMERYAVHLGYQGIRKSKENTGAPQRTDYWKYVIPGITLHR